MMNINNNNNRKINGKSKINKNIILTPHRITKNNNMISNK